MEAAREAERRNGLERSFIALGSWIFVPALSGNAGMGFVRLEISETIGFLKIRLKELHVKCRGGNPRASDS
jgi:hypothetical protein